MPFRVKVNLHPSPAVRVATLGDAAAAPPSISLAELTAKLAALWGHLDPATIEVAYLDDDGDLLAIINDEHAQQWINTHTQAPARLTLVPRNPPPSAPASVIAPSETVHRTAPIEDNDDGFEAILNSDDDDDDGNQAAPYAIDAARPPSVSRTHIDSDNEEEASTLHIRSQPPEQQQHQQETVNPPTNHSQEAPPRPGQRLPMPNSHIPTPADVLTGAITETVSNITSGVFSALAAGLAPQNTRTFPNRGRVTIGSTLLLLRLILILLMDTGTDTVIDTLTHTLITARIHHRDRARLRLHRILITTTSLIGPPDPGPTHRTAPTHHHQHPIIQSAHLLNLSLNLIRPTHHHRQALSHPSHPSKPPSSAAPTPSSKT